MQQILFSNQNFKWVDVVGPTASELLQIADEFRLRKDFIRDSMDPKHLPKYEKEGDSIFVIVRHFDLEAKRRANTTTKLTRKVAVVVTPKLLLTIHRKAQPFFQNIATRLNASLVNSEIQSDDAALQVLDQAMQTFESQIELMEKDLELLEDGIFQKQSYTSQLTETHRIVRKLSIFKRILIHTAGVFQRWSSSHAPTIELLKKLTESNAHMIFFSDELLEDGRSLLQLHLSLASHRTGEIMRVLTVFSVFFMPLTFIVGVYGMNFKFMPELEWPLGYLSVWILMGAITTAIAIWFFKRGWLASSDKISE
jgi:magnesium transporter